MKLGSLLPTALLLAVSAMFVAPPQATRACGPDYEILSRTRSHPDLPLSRFFAGNLGLLEGGYSASYLVAAYRWLTPVGMSDAEQAAAVRRIEGAPADTRGIAAWKKARGSAPTTRLTVDYARVDNCLPDAFGQAAALLGARRAEHGAQSADVRRFVEGQDAVFANCDGGPASIPPPLVDATPQATADRDYQIAAAHLYAMHHDEAARRFGALARDAASPYRARAAYLVARSRVRKATMVDDPDAWPEALASADAVLADPGAAPYHAAARRLQARARYYAEPGEQLRRLAVSLASQSLGADLEYALADYTSLQRHGGPLDLADRLTTWIRIVRGEVSGGPELAARLYAETKADVWLVAALMTASSGEAASVLLAADPDATQPAFATVRFHQARILAERGELDAAYQRLDETVDALGSALPPSARNAFTEAQLASSTTLSRALEHVLFAPAALWTGGLAGGSREPPSFHPEAAAALSAAPVKTWVEAVEAEALSGPPQARLVATAWVRAHWLGQPKLAARLTDRVIEGNPKIGPLVERVRDATDDVERRLALVHLMLRAPTARPTLRRWDREAVEPEAISSSWGEYWWCGLPAAPLPPWVAAAAGSAAKAERATLDVLAPNALAAAAVKLARARPDDTRVPELLHLAVRATRYGCRDAETTALSGAAFRHLHRHYPDDPFTAKTPYHY